MTGTVQQKMSEMEFLNTKDEDRTHNILVDGKKHGK